MPVVQVPAELTIDHLIQVVEQLPSDELASKRGIPLLVDEEEQALLSAIVGSRLPSETQRRLDELREKSREGTLTPEEHAELLAFVQQVEQQDVARTQALVDLAQKRGITVSELMHDLGAGFPRGRPGLPLAGRRALPAQAE